MTKPPRPRLIEPPFDAGVYVIRAASSGRVYVGATGGRLSIRLSAHRSALRGGWHSSRALQREWDRTGGEGFTFEVLERVPRDQLDTLGEREAWWME